MKSYLNITVWTLKPKGAIANVEGIDITARYTFTLLTTHIRILDR